jgi:hypothetical protein
LAKSHQEVKPTANRGFKKVGLKFYLSTVKYKSTKVLKCGDITLMPALLKALPRYLPLIDVPKFIAILFLSLCFCSCFQLFDVGPNTLIKESYNPQQSKKAILFQKSGNATVDNSLQVSVVGYDYELDKKEVGNAFTVEWDHNKSVQDSTSIDFTWLSNDTLKIDFDKKLRTFLQNGSVNGVTIIYEAR